MTKYTRLTSETSLIDYIKGLERKIDAQATKGSGDIIVADESGVETVIGTLPDGSVGFEQFVGDTTPPPVATMPAVSAQPGTFVVSWDGTFEGGAAKPRDFVHVNVIGHKMNGSTTVFSVPLGVIRLVTESVLVNLDVAAGGESWQFSLESEDYSGNKAQWSARTSSYMMLDAISTTDQAWTDLNADVAGKGRTFTQSVAPPIEERLPQNLWIDTSAGPGLYVTRYWDTTAGQWLALKDKDAKAAQDTADTKGVTIYSSTTPAVSAQLPQNLWVDTTGGINIQKRWVQGSGWVVVSDSRIASNSSAVTAADNKAQNALDTANSKGRTYTQGVAPPVEARLPQNLWIDTSLGVNLSVTKFWDATANSGAGAWVPVKDQEINAAETRAAADAKAKADAAAATAINAQAYTTNPSFDDWTGSAPAGYANYNVGPTKETTIFRRGPYAARFNCTDTTTNRGLSFSGIFTNAPDIEYWTVQVTFQLVSGTSLSGAGVRLDWAGQTVPAGTQPTLQLINEVPSPITGKWYTITKTLRKAANSTGTYTGMTGYLFANYNANGLGVLSVKDIVFDWLDIRPASVSEILAYTAPTTSSVAQAKQEAIDAASLDAKAKADAAQQNAIDDTTTKLAGKNKVVWSPDPASGTSGYTAGDTWFQRDGTGQIIAQWEWVASPTAGWQSRKVSEAVLGNISAGKITSGIIDANLIAAGSISAEKLLLGSMDNLLENGSFEYDLKGWGSVPASFTVDNTGRLTPKSMKVTGITARVLGPVSTGYIPLDTGDSFRLSGWVKTNASSGHTGEICLYYADGAKAYLSNTSKSITTATSTYQYFSWLITPPANAAYMNVRLNATMPSASSAYWFDDISVVRASSGELIVDGAIDGKTITGATLQTEQTANRGIKLTSTEFSGYDTSGTKNFSLTSSGTLTLKGSLQSGSTIAGATITGALETTATASRGVKLSNTGIRAWDGSGNPTFVVDATTGQVEVPGLKANSITGDMVAGSTITANNLFVGDFANLATIDELNGTTITSNGQTQIVGGYNSLVNDTGTYLMFTEKRGPVPFYQGDTIYYEFTAKATAATTAAFAVWTYDAANASSSTSSPSFSIGTTDTLITGQVPVSSFRANAVKFIVGLTGVANKGIQVKGVKVYKKFGGQLIVDGAIDGKTITGATVQTEATASRGIKLTSAELAGYDGAGAKSFSLTSAGALTLKGTIQSGSSIQGASLAAGGGGIETSTSANTGVKLQNSGIKAYDGTNMTFSVDAATGIVDAPGIRTNSLSGDKIIAKSMTLDKLVVTSTDNLLMEADFSNLGASWQLPAGLTINPTAGRGSLPAMRLTGTTSTLTSLNYNDVSLNIRNKIAIDSGDRFHGSMWVKSTATAVAGSYKIIGRFYTTATAYTDITIASSPALAANVWTNVEAIVPNTIPTGVIAAEWYLSLKNAATGTITDVDFVSVTKASTGALIVDGAIDGKVITGATIRTAASGARIVLDDSTLNAWNTAGDNYFSMSDADGVNISSKGKAGYSLQRTNFCTNPSFTTDTSGWVTSQTGVRDTSVFYSSPASMKLTHTATADRSVSRLESNALWSNVRFSVYVRHNAATAKTVTAKFYYTDGAGAALATYSGTATSVAANTWTRISVTSTAPSPGGTAGTKLEVVGTGFTSTETLWIDGALYEQTMNALPSLGAYFDGNTASTSTLTYAWDGTANLSKSYEQTYNDIRIKSGGNNVLVPNVTASNLAPGIGFISPTNPLQQTAGLFSSDGKVVSLIEGASDPQLSRIDVGNGKVLINSSGDMDLNASNGVINISPSMAGFVSINSDLRVSAFMGINVDKLSATSLTFSNGWSHFGSGYGNCQAKEVMPGVVLLQGMAKPGTKTDGVIIAVLPPELRPNRIQNIGCSARTNLAAPNTDQPGLLSINPNGNVTFYCNNIAYVTYATLNVSYFLNSP